MSRERVGSSAATDEDLAPLTSQQVSQWRSVGAVAVDGVVPLELVQEARAAAVAAAPPPVEGQFADFGQGGFTFPSECTAFNEVTLHPRLLHSVAQLLGAAVRDVRLTQSDLWIKDGRTRVVEDERDNNDQRMHVDYPNHTLTHPPEFDAPEAVEIIIYADDIDECGGATRVVLRDGADDPAYRWPIVDTPGVGSLPWVNDRETAEARLAQVAPEVARFRAEHLYAREREVAFAAGTVLFYRHDTWHRGSPVNAGATRVVHNLTFRHAASEWVSTLHPGWTWAMYRPSQVAERLIATATVEQRGVLGFPTPGNPYWTERTIAAVEARYGHFGFDATEYRSAIHR